MPVETDSPGLLLARMVNEFVYCPRLFYLEWAQGEFEASADTLDGNRTHRRVDEERGEAPAPEEWTTGLKVKARAVTLSSERLGLIAKLDLLEDDDGKACPVDFKRGHGPSDASQIWDADRVQLGVQMMLLRENGYPCERGFIYYYETRRRVPLDWSEGLEQLVREAVNRAQATATSGRLPPPLVDSPKCPRCSLVGICLPDEVNALTGVPATGNRIEPRNLMPARDDALPLYVQAQGALLSKKGDVVEVRQKDALLASSRLMEISQVSVFGSVTVTPGALHELYGRGIPVCHFSFGGWFYGITHGLVHKNVELRIRQFRAASDPCFSLPIAQGMVRGKIRNCRTLLRRNHPGDVTTYLDELGRLADLADSAAAAQNLLAIEGAAAKTYFAHFGGMLKADSEGGEFRFDFVARNRRPPTDPVNALLSFLYAILAKDATVVLQSVGFDPMLGFFHRPRYGRPSLALDLMEEFRPLLADSVVLALINNRELSSSDFVRRAGAVALTAQGRKKVLASYERRMSTEVTHPIFGYTISYRRVLEVQARLLSRFVMGEVPAYPPFCTR